MNVVIQQQNLNSIWFHFLKIFPLEVGQRIMKHKTIQQFLSMKPNNALQTPFPCNNIGIFFHT